MGAGELHGPTAQAEVGRLEKPKKGLGQCGQSTGC